MVTAGIFPFKENSHGRTRNRTRDLMISSQKLWPLDHEAGHTSVCLYTQIYFQQTAPYIILKLLHVSANNRSLLQESTVLEDIGSLLWKFAVVNGELYTLFT